MIDSKTKGPFLIQLCLGVRSLPVIAKNPVMNVVEEAMAPSQTNSLIEFSPQLDAMPVEAVSFDWITKSIPLMCNDYERFNGIGEE